MPKPLVPLLIPKDFDPSTIPAGEAPPITQDLVNRIQAEKAQRAYMDPKMEKPTWIDDRGIYQEVPQPGPPEAPTRLQYNPEALPHVAEDNPAFVKPGGPIEISPKQGPNPRIMWAQESPQTDFEDLGDGLWQDMRTGRIFRANEPEKIITEWM